MTVHVKSPIPSLANLPGRPNALIYMLDLDFVIGIQRERLIAHLAGRFGIPEGVVARELDSHGVPILADDCEVSMTNLQKKWC